MTTKTWTTAINGDFADTAKWTGGSPASTDDAVLAADGGAAYTASSSAGPTVNSIQTAANATLSITGGAFKATNGTGAGANAGHIVVGNNSSLSIGGTFNNSGNVAINSGGNLTDLFIATNTTLTGGGTVVMGDSSANRFYGAASTTLTNANNTISGGGQLGAAQNFTLVNQAGGTINANAAGNQLILNVAAPVSNAGLLEATGGGAGLRIQSTTVNQTGVGSILAANASHVDLQSAIITGGTLKTSGTGVIQTVDGGTILDSTTNTVTNQNTLTILNNTALSLKGTLNNIGSIAINSGGNITDLFVATNTTLSGGGTVVMSDNGANRFYGAASTTLTNANNTISGGGQLGVAQNFTLINQAAGIINATATNNQLIINVSTQPVTNAGLIEATGAAGLLIQSTKVDNSTGGIFQANTGSQIRLQSANIIGGVFKSVGTGTFNTVDGGNVLDGQGTHKLVVPGNIVINNNTALTLQGSLTLSQKVGAVTTNGTLTLNSAGNLTDLIIGNKNASISKGNVILSDSTANRIRGTFTGGAHPKTSTLTNSSIITGAGNIGIDLILKNSGTINATGASTLVIATGHSGLLNSNVVTNTGTLEATNPNALAATGGLVISNTVILNSTKGFIIANGANTHVDLQSATIKGGTLQTSNGGIIRTIDSSSVLDGTTLTVKNQNNVAIINNTALTLKGTINNVGAIAVNSLGNSTDLIMGAATTLTGAGQIALTDNSANRIYGATAGTILTNTNNTISGAGQLGLAQLTLVNQVGGTINATGAGNQLVLNTGANTVTNAGLIEATGAAGLLIQNTTVNDTTGGFIKANTGSHVDLQNATIIGSTLQAAGTGFYETVGSSSVLDSSAGTITSQALINIRNNEALTIKGPTFNNSAIIALNSGGNSTDLIFGTATTLTGGGQITLTDNGANRIYGTTGAITLTNSNNTISGAGQIGTAQLTLVNQAGGTINATGTNQLILNTSGGTSNAGLIEATGTAGLLIQNTTLTNTTGGVIKANNGSHVDLQNSTIIGSTLQAAGTGFYETIGAGTVLDAAGGTFTSQALINIRNNENLTIKGPTFNNTATIALNSGGNSTDLIFATATTLTGGGQILLTDNGANRIFGAAGATTLTNSNNIISGAGQIGAGQLTLVNQVGGTINATGGNQLILNTSGGTSNAGLIEATGAGGLLIQNTALTNAVGGIVQAATGSHVDIQNSTISGGTLKGTGTAFYETIGSNSVLDGSSATLNNQAVVNIRNNENLTLKGAINNTGTIAVNSGGNSTDLILGAATTLTGGGQITLSDNANNRFYGTTAAITLTNTNNTISGAGQLGVAQLTLVNQAGGTINANATNALNISTGGSTVTNAGLLEATNSGGLNISNAVNNTGSIVANGGKVTVSGALTGTGTETIKGASVIEDVAASSNNVTFFAASTGTLKLDTAQSFTGSVTGFNSHNALDLANINNSTATTSFAGGVLTVSDGTTTAHIALSGSYAGATFAHSDDGSGHAKITVTGPGLVTQPAAQQAALFAQSVAAFGSDHGTLGEHSDMFASSSARQPVLASAHRLAA